MGPDPRPLHKAGNRTNRTVQANLTGANVSAKFVEKSERAAEREREASSGAGSRQPSALESLQEHAQDAADPSGDGRPPILRIFLALLLLLSFVLAMTFCTGLAATTAQFLFGRMLFAAVTEKKATQGEGRDEQDRQ